MSPAGDKKLWKKLLKETRIGTRHSEFPKLPNLIGPYATTMLFIEGVADAIIRKMTGHRSEQLLPYEHFSPTFKQQTAELIAGKLTEEVQNRVHPTKKKKATLTSGPQRYWQAIRDNLRNFFLSPPAEMLSFLQQLRGISPPRVY